MNMNDISFSSPFLGLGVTLGNLAIWLGLGSALLAVGFYWAAMLRAMRRPTPVVSPDQPIENGGERKKRAGRAGKNGSHAATPPDPYERRTEQLGLWGRRAFLVTCLCTVVGSLCLWSLILTQQYSLHYIWKNSNNALAFGYRFASFWGDQEGTFFLWGLYNTGLGLVLLRRAREDERWVMPFFGLVNVSLFSLLSFMNPFWFEDPAGIREMLTREQAPAEVMGLLPSGFWEQLSYYFGWAKYLKMLDGKGLNESLQNPWMVIHPPTLFLGYSSLMIPASYALGALMRRDYDGWATRAASWLTFAWGILGTGIFLGAYWAYETLGWGGYWSWDPVENSSIIPWLTGTALLHGLIAQRVRGNYKQANLFLGVMLGVSVLLGSFLVRSGVLSEVSVHSFASPQQSVFWTLVAALTIWFLLGMGIWFWRYRDIQGEIAYENVWERHFGFFLGLIVLSAIALIVTFGVTLPVWGPWLRGGEKASVEYTFYNKALLPVIFMTVLLMGITPLMPWRKVREDAGLKPIALGVLIGMGVVGLFFLFAALYAWQGGFTTQNDPAYLAFGLMVVLALIPNFQFLFRSTRAGILQTGPWLAHIGFILMLGGVVVTSRFNTTQMVTKLEMGQSVRILGREFSFQGQRAPSGPADRDRLLIDMKMPDGKVIHFAPKLFISKQDRANPQTMAWPEIRHEWFGGLWGDLYVSPSGVDLSNMAGVKELHKEEPAVIKVQRRSTDPEEEVSVIFHGLDTAELQREMKQQTGKPAKIYGLLTVEIAGNKRE
ncbi:MAG: hypothetical protein FJX77_06870, partial [Armatimonadetes bacterium]|nr:hypothetical protein [Armatimonadota bacterium]